MSKVSRRLRLARAALAFGGPDGRPFRRAWRRLVRVWPRGHDGEELIGTLLRLAADDPGPLGRAARAEAYRLWDRTRDPRLRARVLRDGLRHAGPSAPPAAYALSGALLSGWRDAWTGALRHLVADPDEDVRAGAVQVCVEAAEPLLGRLWHAAARAREPGWPAVRTELARNPNPMAPDTRDLVWRLWLDDPSLLDVLRRHGRPATSGPLLRVSRLALNFPSWAERCAGAVAEDVPDHLRARLIADCREHGAQPEDPVRRAAFWALAGDARRLRDADPHGALLAEAYRAASERHRARLRKAMAGLDGLDPIPLLTRAHGHGRVHEMNAAERAFAVQRLADRSAWDELWRTALGLPLAEAIAAAHLCAEAGWTPSDDIGLDLLTALRGTSPNLVAEAVAAALQDEPQRVPVPLDVYGSPLLSCALSPDGSRLAAVTRPFGEKRCSVTEVALPSGERTGRWEIADVHAPTMSLLHTGTAPVAAWSRGPLERLDPGGGTTVLTRSAVVSLAHVPGGFAALTADHELLGFASDGTPGERLSLLGDLRFDLDPAPVVPRILAAAPDAPVVALVTAELAVVDLAEARVLARAPGTSVTPRSAAFTAADRLVTALPSAVWRIRDGGFEGEPFGGWGGGFHRYAAQVAAFPVHGQVAVEDAEGWRCRDAVSGGPAVPSVSGEDPQARDEDDPSAMGRWSHVVPTPSGRHALLYGSGGAEVHGHWPGPAERLLARPLGSLSLDDLRTPAEGLPFPIFMR